MAGYGTRPSGSGGRPELKGERGWGCLQLLEEEGGHDLHLVSSLGSPREHTLSRKLRDVAV